MSHLPPRQEPAMPPGARIREQPRLGHAARTPARRRRCPHYEPIEEDDWLEEPEELPHRPRRRLLARSLSRCSACCWPPAGSSAACSSRRARPHRAPPPEPRRASPRASRRFAAAASSTSTSGSSSSSTGFARPTAGTVAYISRRHAVRDQLRRQHRQGHDLGGHQRDQDRQINPDRHPSGRNGHHHRRHRLGWRRQRRIDQRRLDAAAVSRRCSAARAGRGSSSSKTSSEPSLFGSGG